jgi:hypothetical protein
MECGEIELGKGRSGSKKDSSRRRWDGRMELISD